MSKRLSKIIEAFLVCFLVLMIPLPINAETSDDLVPISSADALTIYEQTGVVYTHTFLASDLMGPGGTFMGTANEYYTVTSNGTYLTIHCFRDDWWSGHGVGNNIVAVRLDGVPDFPEGIWASLIIDYTLGYNGIAESRFNALGVDTQIGPYAPTPEQGLCTYMGDQHSELVLGFVRTPAPPPPTPDFSISISPATRTITPGQSTTYAVTITSINGFNAEVELSYTISPSSKKVSAAFDSPSVTPLPDGSTELALTVSAGRGAKTSFHTIEIRGFSEGEVRLETVTLAIAWYELHFEIDYMEGHEPTGSVLAYIEDYYIKEGICVNFSVDDLVPSDPFVTKDEFWAIERNYNDIDDIWANDEWDGKYYSKWKWVLFGTESWLGEYVSGSCYVPQPMFIFWSDRGGNYIFIADQRNDDRVPTIGQGVTEEAVEKVALMHEMGHSIGILSINWFREEIYDSKDYSVMDELTRVNCNADPIRYSRNYWNLRDVNYYEI